MTFSWPWALLSLLVIPLLFGITWCCGGADGGRRCG